jgi:uncharacterized HAD superfamily protein
MRFGIDLDGCLCDFNGEVIKMANRLFNKNLPSSYVTSVWNYSDILTKEEWKAVWDALMDMENFWLQIGELPGLRQLHAFLAQNHDAQVYFITSRAQSKGLSTLAQTTEWLERRGLWPRFDFDRSRVRSRVIVTEASEKWKYLNALDIQWYLDDYAPTIQGLQSYIETMHAFLLDTPYNIYADSLPRVYSVAEYLRKIGHENS